MRTNLTSSFFRLTPLLATGSILASCASETGLRVLPHETDRIPLDASELTRLCLPPNEDICPLNTQTGALDADCQNQIDGMWDFYADKFTQNGLSLADLVNGNHDYTLMAHGYAWESRDSLTGHGHTIAQLTFVPGNHYHELKGIMEEYWLSPLHFANTEGFPPGLLAMVCKAEISKITTGNHLPENHEFREFYDFDLYTGLDFYLSPDWFSENFADGLAGNFMYNLDRENKFWYSGTSRCDENPNADGLAGSCGLYGGEYDLHDTEVLWSAAAENYKAQLGEFLDWGTQIAALDPDEISPDNQYWNYGKSAQIYYCNNGQCFQE